jgi:hypothetical protein
MAFKLFYYLKRFGYNELPTAFFKKKFQRLRQFENQCNQQDLAFRIDYYIKLENKFKVPEQAVSVKNFKRTKGTEYYLDLKDFLHYFKPNTSFAYQFGDKTTLTNYPTLTKARPIYGANENAVLFKLNKRRHFNWVNDQRAFADKEDKLVWRGGAYNALRREFVERFYNNPNCNVGQTNKKIENVPWQKEYLAVAEQLKYKFIFCPEGNDVATNLKWVLSSNSLCFMPKPKFETWFMEGLLKPGIHYVEIKNDLSDIEEKINYYSKNIEEAQNIIDNANKHVQMFQNEALEDIISIKVLERYAVLSGQSPALKFD